MTRETSAAPLTDDDLTRVFNTALVASQTLSSARNPSSELFSALQTPAFRAILTAVRQLSRDEGISESQAAETLVGTFRQLNAAWHDYVLQEGIARLKGSPLK